MTAPAEDVNNPNQSTVPRIVYAYEASQEILGQIVVKWPANKPSIEHGGLKVTLVGRIDVSMGVHEGQPHTDFVSMTKELAPPGHFTSPAYYNTNNYPGNSGPTNTNQQVFEFRFKNMDLELESYHGRNVAVKYLILVRMERKFLPPLTQEQEVWVQCLGQPPPQDEAIKMEVGIEDCLHIEFSYPRRAYHLQATIVGQILFLLVRIKIKHMELAVIRRETSGEGVAAAVAATEGSTSAVNPAEAQTLVKYEIMDGAPVKGELIPVQLSLRGIPADLTPTYTAIHNRFSVRYFLNLVLVDEDDRRYFKQQEIILWRKELG
jgi:vacuolar protein sorting-associated protein 26